MRAVESVRPGRIWALAVVLFAVITATSVHGAGSSASPAGAIATAPASIGAALAQAAPPTGRAGVADDSPGRSGSYEHDGRPLEEPIIGTVPAWIRFVVGAVAAPRAAAPEVLLPPGVELDAAGPRAPPVR